MIEIVDSISAQLVLDLARLGWPPLADLVNGDVGRILVGDHTSYGQFVPPRVIFRPTKSPFAARNTNLGARPTSAGAGERYTAEGRAAIANPAFLAEEFAFEVSCWGICPRDEDVEPRANEFDYEFTRGLYTTLIAAMQIINANNFKVEAGAWRGLRHTPRIGREFFFNLTIGLPVLRLGQSPPPVRQWTPGEPARVSPKAIPDPLGVEQQGSAFAASGVEPEIADAFETPTGDTEAGCEEP